MKRLFTIMLFAAMLLPWTSQGQIMPNYTFRTGVDSSKWITLDASATQVHGTGRDTEVSDVLNIGFNFQFGEMFYSQFSVTTDGFMRLGPEAYSTAWEDANFNSAYFPKIAAVVKDLATGSDGYVKYQLVNQAPSRVLVAEFKLTRQYSTTSSAEVLVQIQLHEDSNKVVLAYASTAPSESPSSYQIGLGVAENDFLLINPGTHTTTHYTALTEASASVWPGAGRYYEFVAPTITCPTPSLNSVSNLTDNEATISWQEGGSATAWIVEYDTAGFTPGTSINSVVVYDSFYTLINLNPSTTYDVYVRSFCSTTDTSRRNHISFRTPCVAYETSALPFTESFETWSTSDIDPCFMKGSITSDSYYASYPTVSTYNAHTGSNSISFYSASFKSYLILPNFEASINELQVSFYAKSTSSYYSVPIMLGTVSVDGNINTFDTIAYLDITSSSWQEYTFPLGHYQGNNTRLAILCPDSYSYATAYLDDITVELLPNAPTPMDITASATGTETAVVRWVNTGAAEFQVSYGLSGFSPETGTIETVIGSDSLEIYGLTASTMYEAYVRAYYNGDSSIWIGPAQFHTHCIALTDNDLPYHESFASWISTTNRNYCYTLNNSYDGSLSEPSLTSTPSNDSTNSVYMYSGATYASWMSLPNIDTYVEGLQVSFSMYKTSTYEYPLAVGVMTNPNDLSTFDTVAVVKCVNINRWENFVIPLSSYQGEGQYITFLSPSGVASGNYIDNITVDYLANCTNPINLSARAIDHESAVVYYTATSTSGSVVAEYGPIGFQLGTGMQEIGNGDSIVLSGLSAATAYEVYVYTDCGGEQSAISDALSFRTACSTDPIDVSFVAYNEDFNSYTTDIASTSTTPSTYPNHTLPDCWNFVNMSGNSSSYPQAFLSRYENYAVSGNCLFFRSSNSTPIYAVLPEFSSNIEDLRLRFTYRNEGVSQYNGTLSIGVMTDPNNDSTFCTLETFAQTTTKTDVEYVFSADTIIGIGYYIAFRYTGGSNDNYYLGIDNVIVDLAPECDRPIDVAVSNIQTTQADLSWTNENGTSFEIAYGPMGFSLDSVDDYTIEYSSTTSVTLYNLTSNTRYDVYVRAICADASEWSQVCTFKTECDLLNAPYSENFNSYSGNGISTYSSVPTGYPNNHTTPDCWSFNMSSNANNGTKIFLSSNSDYRVGNSGNCLFFNGNNGGAGYAILPHFSNPIDSLYIELTYRYEDYSTGYGILGVMTDPTIDSTFIPVDTLDRTTTLRRVNHAFWDDTLTGTGYYIAIKWDVANTSTVYYFSIDDVSVTAPTCRPSTNIMATNITSNSADITWNNATADSYVVAYSTTPNFDPTTCTTTINTTNTTATITGLSTYTQYYYSVKTMCGSEDLGWSDIYSFFTTASCSGNLTQVEPIIGTGTNVTAYLPFYSYSSYYASYPEATSWQIYTNQELEMAGAYSGNINSISFQYDDASTPLTLTFKVYMAQTSLNAFANDSDTIPLSQMTLVYNGTKEFNQNSDWTTIILDTPFQYSDTSNLIVAIERNVDIVSEGYFKYSSTSEDRAVYKYRYVDSYYGDNYYYSSTTNYRNNIMFNMCTDVPACPRPRDIVVSNIQSTQVDVSYNSSATSFEIAYGLEGFDLNAAGTYQTMQVTDTFATITNLTPGTRYDVYVRAICSATETSEWSFAIRSFFTSCVSQALPYSENFDSYTTDVSTSTGAPNTYPNHIMPNCWSFVNMSNNTSSYPQAFLTSTNSYVVTGNSLFFKSSETTPIYSVLPKFDVSIDSLYIEFAYRNESTYSGNGTLTLGVMTDPSNPTTFVALEVYPINDAITAIEHYFSMDTLQGNNYYIAFRYQGGSNNYYLSIDNIFVDYAPSCFKPRNLVASNPGQTTMDLIWNDPNAAGEYVVEYRKSLEPTWTAVYGITDTFTTVTNLSPSSAYEFRVKAVCGMYDSSYFSDIATARTLCGAVQLPFGEDFSATGFLYDCWSKLEGIAFSTTGPSTPSSSYGGFGHSAISNGLQGSHVKVNIYGTSTKYWLVTPEIDLTNVSASQLTFDLALTDYANGDTIEVNSYTYDDKFMVIVSTDTGNTWLQQNATIWSDDTTINANYSYRGIYNSGQQITIDLSQYSGNIIKIAFYAESTVGNSNGLSGGDNDLHIDNILISEGSACPAPTMTVTPDATTATLTWTADATNFEIEYKEVSADEWSQTIAVSNVTSYTITGLVPETDYMIRLRSVCEEGEYSAWKTTTITTPTLPCLAPTNVTATTIGLTSATITWTDPTNNQTSWTIEYGYGDNIQTVTATTTSVELTNLYSGTTYTVRVQGSCAADVYSDWSDAYSFTTATCQTVSNLVADGITSSSATITWTAPAGQTKWELSYGMQGVDEEHGTKVTVTVNPTFTIEGLEEDMSYDVYVRAVCGENTYSSWSTKLQFTTRPVSINTAATDNVNVRIYPNPANTEATISVEGINGKVEFAIADMNGRMIVTETINCDGQLVKTIDVSNLAKGAYFVHIYNDNVNTTRKLIVK